MGKAFRDFITKGNLVQLAVAFILGAAFATMVKSFVDDLLMPIIGKLVGNVEIFMYRREHRKEPEFASADSVLGFRRMILGKVKIAWLKGRYLEAWRLTFEPDRVEGSGVKRAPEPADVEWICCRRIHHSVVGQSRILTLGQYALALWHIIRAVG